MKTKMCFFVLLGLLGFAGLAFPDTITLNIDTKFSGGVPELAPSLVATFTDTGLDQVTLVLSVNNAQQGTNLPAVQEWYFNLKSPLDVTSLGITAGTKTGAFTAPTWGRGNNAYQADGDGSFDFVFKFDWRNNDSAINFDLNDSATFTLTMTGLQAKSFYDTSLSGGNSATDLLSAANVSGVSGQWWADLLSDNPSPSVVPEPGSLLLLGTGLSLMGLAVRRKRK